MSNVAPWEKTDKQEATRSWHGSEFSSPLDGLSEQVLDKKQVYRKSTGQKSLALCVSLSLHPPQLRRLLLVVRSQFFAGGLEIPLNHNVVAAVHVLCSVPADMASQPRTTNPPLLSPAARRGWARFPTSCEPEIPANSEITDSVRAGQQGKANAELRDLVDKITAELVKGDLGVIGDLQDVFARTRRATLPAGEQ